MRVAIIHYWLLGIRGGEKVLEQICQLFPKADIFTLFLNPKCLTENLAKHKIFVSKLNKIPFSKILYKKMLCLMPRALKRFNLSGYDLVISSESGPAKGVIVPDNVLHICYVHSPMRYIWNMYDEYRKSVGFITRFFLDKNVHKIREWDMISANSVDFFIANSCNVQDRVNRYWDRDSHVIYPPVDVSTYNTTKKPKNYYLVVSHLVPYKRIDLVVEAFNESGRPLVIIGEGGEYRRLTKMAKDNIIFLGRLPIDELHNYYAQCQAFIFPGEEDFGITPLEAQACGRPVIAFAKGGALESVINNKSGIFFMSKQFLL